jgi:phosphate/sulfate permease
MVGMVVSAIVGFLALLGFVTVRWPGDSGRIVMAIFLFSIVGFVVCGSASIFTAARDTYATYTPEESPGEE